jgi:hypothetical protein
VLIVVCGFEGGKTVANSVRRITGQVAWTTNPYADAICGAWGFVKLVKYVYARR